MAYEHVMDFIKSNRFQMQMVVEMSGMLLHEVKERA
jgi:hypothetical protein